MEEIESKAIESLIEELTKRLGARITGELGAIPLGGNYRPDKYLMLEVSEDQIPLVIEVKGHIASLYPLKKLISFSKEFDGVCCLVADAIDFSVKEQLKKLQISYYEINNELFFPITYKTFNAKNGNDWTTLTSSKGFHTESNLKLLFYLVVNPESLKFTQRQLADKLGISLASVNIALKNLEKVGVLRINKKGEKILGDIDEIIDRWRISYADIEKKKLYVGRFSPIDESFYSSWEKISLEKIRGYWGGEAGASIETKYLSPEVFTIYTYENSLGQIIKNLRLKKDPKGKIEIVKAFWPEEVNNSSERVVPKFLTYCELINSGIDRNKETATLLKDKLLN